MSNVKRILLLTVLLCLASVTCAQAKEYRGVLWSRPSLAHTHRWFQRHHPHHGVSVVAPLPSYPTMTTGAGGNLPDACGAEPVAGMKVARVILYWDAPLNLFYRCAQNIVASEEPLILSIQWNPAWSIAQTQAWFQSAISLYGPLHPYAMSIGNEEELWYEAENHAGPVGYAQSYSNVWKTVEPMIAAQLPHTLRVAGEFSPWGMNFMSAAAAYGLPGAQVFAGHAYPDSGRGFDPTLLSRLAQQYHVQPWITEGMCGPFAWNVYGCRTQESLHQEGIALAIEWYAPPNTTQTPAPPSTAGLPFTTEF